MGDIMREQLALEGDDRTRLVWAGPGVRLEAQPALHLALVLHELGTNARKHGALSAAQGRVSVHWRVADEGRTLRLVWEENGGPAVRPPTKRGFGSTLIEQSLLAHGGRVRLEFAPAGLRCELTLPLPPNALPDTHPQNQNAELAASARALARTLTGKRILIVEDEPLIAMALSDDLADLGCGVVGPAHTLAHAQALIVSESFDGALLDGNLSGARVDEIAAALTQKGAPFAFVTGYGREALPAGFRHAPVVEKPFTRAQIADALATLFGRAGAAAWCACIGKASALPRPRAKATDFKFASV